MQVNKESLYLRYRAMESEELVELVHARNLTFMELDVLEKILSERNVTYVDRATFLELLEQEAEEQMMSTVSLASIGSRFVALIIDAIILFFILVLPIVLFSFFSFLAPDRLDVFVLIGLVGFFLYLFFHDGLPNGQSIGKHALRIAVVDKTSGKRCSLGASFLRNMLLVSFFFVDLLFLCSSFRQRLGDKLANTIVVNVK